EEDKWNFGNNFIVNVIDKPVVVKSDETVVAEFYLEQNYPNPFNPNTTIKFKIANRSFTSLKVYDVIGNEVSSLVNKELAAGEYQFTFKANNLTSGIYIYKLATSGFSQSKKMLLLK
ncbi:MAG: T9SS type A sorting domain-containing protein, partial [Nitrososphaeraceae archaeon]|nr:T9SS type A sorting domain-containing protein [Nitrososphaeraceae archaeon]